MPSAIVGTFTVGSGIRVGQFELGKPKLRLLARPFSLTVQSGIEGVIIPTRARMRLLAREFTLFVEQRVALPSARLHLAGRSYIIIVPVGPTYPERPLLRLRTGSYSLTITQNLSFGKPVLSLVPRRLYRVGVPGLIPTIPELIILTPSPAEAGLLVPTTVEPGELLTPSPVRNI